MGRQYIPPAAPFEDPAPLAPVFTGDFGSPGLRVAYARRPLKAGQVVNFAQRGMSVQAQVLWTLQSGTSIQSGLLVQSLDPLAEPDVPTLLAALNNLRPRPTAAQPGAVCLRNWEN